MEEADGLGLGRDTGNTAMPILQKKKFFLRVYDLLEVMRYCISRLDFTESA